MVDCLYRLRHNTVVRRYDQNHDIRYLCTARTHRRERRVTGRIDKRDLLTLCRNRIRTDALRNTACLAARDRRFTDFIEQRRFTVVDVAHNRNDGRAGYELALVLGCRRVHKHVFRRFFGLVLEVDFHIRRKQRRVFIVNRIVNAFHNTYFEQALAYFHRRHTQFFGQYFQRNILRRHDCVFNFNRRNFLFLLLFRRTYLSITALILVEILYRHTLLFHKRALRKRFLFGIRLFVRLFLCRRGERFSLSRRHHRRGSGYSRAYTAYARRTGFTARKRSLARRTGRSIPLRSARAIGRTVTRRIRVHTGFRDVYALFLTVSKITGRTRTCLRRLRRRVGFEFGFCRLFFDFFLFLYGLFFCLFHGRNNLFYGRSFFFHRFFLRRFFLGLFFYDGFFYNLLFFRFGFRLRRSRLCCLFRLFRSFSRLFRRARCCLCRIAFRFFRFKHGQFLQNVR